MTLALTGLLLHGEVLVLGTSLCLGSETSRAALNAEFLKIIYIISF